VVEIPLSTDGWHVAGWFVVQEKAVKLAAVTVFPGSDRETATPGEFELQRPQVAKLIQHSPLTSAVLEDGFITELYNEFFRCRPLILDEDFPLPLPKVDRMGRPGGRPVDDSEYLWFAVRYDQLVREREKAPNKIMAAELKVGSDHIRDKLTRCRERGLLTRPGRGRVGGCLTPKAQELWRIAEKGKRRRR